MDQRLPPCAHRAPRLPVPPTTMSTYPAPLYTAAWPHHPDAAYRPLLPDTAGMTMSHHGQTSTAGYSSPYSVPPTLSQMGITSPGHVARWCAPEGYDGMTPPWPHMMYSSHPYTPPTPCGSDSETQDDRFPLPQTGEI
jgi:hypothetical protein